MFWCLGAPLADAADTCELAWFWEILPSLVPLPYLEISILMIANVTSNYFTQLKIINGLGYNNYVVKISL